MIKIDDAMSRVLAEANPLEPVDMPIVDAVGLILAENVESDIDVPPFDRSTMDGYALRSKDAVADAVIPVDCVIAAGENFSGTVPDGHAVKIMTGAPIPDGCDTVIQIEMTSEPETGKVKIESAIESRRNIAYKGEEIKKGQRVLNCGIKINPAAVAVLAQSGRMNVKVHRRPKVAILVTGSELVEPNEVPGVGQIRESNSYCLLAQCRLWGADGKRAGRSVDNESDLKKMLKKIFKNAPDILIVTGGVSVGDFDLVPKILSEMGVETIFHNVAQKPAKPILFGKREKTFVFGLPGNPVATYIGFELYAGPAIRKMLGDTDFRIRWKKGIASDDFKIKSDRTYLHPVRVEKKEKEWIVHPVPTHGSADIYSNVNANAYARFDEGHYAVASGNEITFFHTRGKAHGA